MNKEIIEKIPLKEKKYLMFETCLMYKKLKEINDHSMLINKKSLSNSFIKKYSKKNKKNISIFETILNLLKPEEQLIINKEYLEVQKKQYWYEDKWSKTTYYKIKHEAINNFLFLLYA